MPNDPKPATPKPHWQHIAEELESLSGSPTVEQMEFAALTGCTLTSAMPAYVAAVILRHHLSSVLFQSLVGRADLPESLAEIENHLCIKNPAFLTTGSREEISAWFDARYALMTARGLQQLRPEPGDVVSPATDGNGSRVVSSVGRNGRVYFKGQPSSSAWPNHLKIVSQMGSTHHAEEVAAVEARLANAKNYPATQLRGLDTLAPYELENIVPPAEAIRGLEELLGSGETREEPFQKLITKYPSLLASAVIGNWNTYVLPKVRFGSEYIPDFLVLGVNSLGPQWVFVEIEAAKHSITNKNGTLSPPTRHAVQQVRDWREWMTMNIAYAHSELGLYGLTNQSPGLVIIGRDTPSGLRQASRAQSEEEAGISIRSWDWVLRNARNLSGNRLHASDFALMHTDGAT